jgi:hypothetical protein
MQAGADLACNNSPEVSQAVDSKRAKRGLFSRLNPPMLCSDRPTVRRFFALERAVGPRGSE